MLRVVVLGYGELAQAIVLGILQTKHKIAGVLRWKRHKPNRLFAFIKDTFAPEVLLSILRTHNIKDINAEKANSKKFIKEMKKLKPDVIIVASWGEILKKEVIDIPEIACINCHPSLLPKHRGSNPYISAIRQGEVKTGVTFHLMSKKIDAGDILLQTEVPISKLDTGASIRKKCAFTAKENIKILLDKLERGEIIPTGQKDSEASYFPVLAEEDAVINWHESAEFIHNQIRGLHPWIKCYTLFENTFLFIKSSEIINLNKIVNEPGKIIKKTEKGILISTGTPDKAILAESIEVYSFIPGLWTQNYIKNKLIPGSYFKRI